MILFGCNHGRGDRALVGRMEEKFLHYIQLKLEVQISERLSRALQ